MPKTTFPYVTGDPVLRSCRCCHSHVAQPAMCKNHPRTCMTCCARVGRRSRLGHPCGLDPREVPPQPKFTAAEREERDADLAQIRNDLGFRPETDAEIAQNATWGSQ